MFTVRSLKWQQQQHLCCVGLSLPDRLTHWRISPTTDRCVHPTQRSSAYSCTAGHTDRQVTWTQGHGLLFWKLGDQFSGKHKRPFWHFQSHVSQTMESSIGMLPIHWQVVVTCSTPCCVNVVQKWHRTTCVLLTVFISIQQLLNWKVPVWDGERPDFPPE